MSIFTTMPELMHKSYKTIQMNVIIFQHLQHLPPLVLDYHASLVVTILPMHVTLIHVLQLGVIVEPLMVKVVSLVAVFA